MTRFYGLKPIDLDSMTLSEVSEYRVQMAIWQRNHPEGA